MLDVLPHFKNWTWLHDLYRNLCEAHTQQRLAHAYFLQGRQGLGGDRLARIFSTWLHCQTPQEGLPCGQCSSCYQAKMDVHPYIHWVQSEGGHSIKIDQIREVIERGSLKNASDRFQIYIVLEAQLMTDAAMNAWLKFLESPADNTLIFIVCESASQVLPTVLSRCQRIVILPPSQKAFETFLDLSGKHYSAEEYLYLAQQTHLCPVAALAIDPQTHLDMTKQFLGQWLRVILGRMPPLLVESPKDLSTLDKIHLMQSSLIDLIKLALGAPRYCVTHHAIADTLMKLAPQFDLTRLFSLEKILNEAKENLLLKQNIHEQLLLDSIFIRASNKDV